MEKIETDDLQNIGALTLEAGLSLLQSGASTERVQNNMKRFVLNSGFTPRIIIDFLSISLHLEDSEGNTRFSDTKMIPGQGVNFKMIASISQLSWKVHEKRIDVLEARKKLMVYKTEPHYNRWVILLFVSLAGAAFCFTFGGGYLEMMVGFLSTFLGLFCKQELIKKSFNPYIITIVSAFIAGLSIGLIHLVFPEIKFEKAFATCVLFLIPGVPLINAITDLVGGFTMMGIIRAVGATGHALAIALGLVLVLKMFGYV